MPQVTISPNPPPLQKAHQLTLSELQALWNKWNDLFPTGFAGMTKNQVMGKIVQVLFENPEVFIILPLLKDLTGIAADIAIVAQAISRFVNDTDQCICDAILCIAAIENDANFGRQAAYEMDNEKKQALLAIANSAMLGAKLNRQGFALDQFGDGINTLSVATSIARELTDTDADKALGACVDTIDVGG